jgi:hypothetical protein
MPGRENADSENILERFAVDCTEPGNTVMSDSETVRWTQGQSGETDECSEDENICLILRKAQPFICT